MKVNLSPKRLDETLMIVKSGDILTLNGEEFDLSPVGEGDTLPSDAINSPWFSGVVERVDGELILTLLIPIPWNYSQEQAFPLPLINVPDGVVLLPQPRPMPEAVVEPEHEEEQIAAEPVPQEREA